MKNYNTYINESKTLDDLLEDIDDYIYNRYYYGVEKFLKFGGDPNHLIYGKTLLLISSTKRNNMKIIKLLLDYGANFDTSDCGYDFLDNLKQSDKEEIINQYPEKYNEYLKNKKISDFNL